MGGAFDGIALQAFISAETWTSKRRVLKRWVDSFLFSQVLPSGKRCTMAVVQTSRHRAPPAFIALTEDCCSNPIETTNRLGMMSYV